MDTVKVYRSRDVVTTSYGVQSTKKEFYLAAEVPGHRGLVRDVAWAPGNIRGYDMIATACQDGYARVFRLETPYSEDDGKSWSAAALLKPNAASAAAATTPGGGPKESTSAAKDGSGCGGGIRLQECGCGPGLATPRR
jgi:nucleoporin SEH1